MNTEARLLKLLDILNEYWGYGHTNLSARAQGRLQTELGVPLLEAHVYVCDICGLTCKEMIKCEEEKRATCFRCEKKVGDYIEKKKMEASEEGWVTVRLRREAVEK